MKATSLISHDCRTFVAGLKSRIAGARLGAARSVNRELILLYWDIGQAIVGKQRAAKWGDSVVEQIAADLRREFPGMQGFSEQNVWRMLQLYEDFTSSAILSQVVRELSAGNAQDLFLRQPADLMEPLALNWKTRRVKELALMEDLVPLLNKRAQGREISGLSACEQ